LHPDVANSAVNTLMSVEGTGLSFSLHQYVLTWRGTTTGGDTSYFRVDPGAQVSDVGLGSEVNILVSWAELVVIEQYQVTVQQTQNNYSWVSPLPRSANLCSANGSKRAQPFLETWKSIPGFLLTPGEQLSRLPVGDRTQLRRHRVVPRCPKAGRASPLQLQDEPVLPRTGGDPPPPYPSEGRRSREDFSSRGELREKSSFSLFA